MTTARKTKRTAGAAKATPKPHRDRAAPETTLGGVVRGVRNWSESMLNVAGAGANVAKMLGMPAFGLSVPTASLQRGAAALKDLREAAGLSVTELAGAINLKDTTPLELMESGKIAILIGEISLGRRKVTSVSCTASSLPDLASDSVYASINTASIILSRPKVGSTT